MWRHSLSPRDHLGRFQHKNRLCSCGSAPHSSAAEHLDCHASCRPRPRLQNTTSAPPSNLPRVLRWRTRCALARGPSKARASARSIGKGANPVVTPRSSSRRKQPERARGHHQQSGRSPLRCAFEAQGPARFKSGLLRPMVIAQSSPLRDSGRGGHAAGQHAGPSRFSAVAGRLVASWHHRRSASTESLVDGPQPTGPQSRGPTGQTSAIGERVFVSCCTAST